MTAHSQTAGALAAKAKAAPPDGILDHLANATAVEYILYGALALIVFSLVGTQAVAIWRRIHARKRSKARVLAMLEEAKEQAQRFEIQSQMAGNRHYLPASLREIGRDRLFFEISGEGELPAPDTRVEVFFRLKDEDVGTVYHKFLCTVLSVVVLAPKRARIELSMPDGLKLGQKRNFYRVKPTPRAVRVLALWMQPEDSPLPTNTADIGQPLYSFTNPAELFAPQEPEDDDAAKPGKQSPQEEPEIAIPVEDISGSGIGLRLPRPENLDAVELGTHMLCLLVYNESSTEANLVRFWCLGKLVNIREPKDAPNSVIFGMEFSHWAILEPDSRDIHWFPNAPQSGVSPISQWVIKQDLEQNRRS